MSYKNQVRTKQIRQKTSSGNYQAFPIGADANLIDMFSTLDLEQELKLGGDHYVEIDEQQDFIQIKEWYFSELRGERTLEEMKEFVTYTVLTEIQNFIIDKIETEDGNREFIIHDEEEQEQDQNYIINKRVVTGGDRIAITLYKGDFDEDQILHQKEIMIKDETPTFTTIDQGVDKEGLGT